MRRFLTLTTGSLSLLGAAAVAIGVILVMVPSPAAAEGQKRCTVTDDRLRELSGLVATETGYIVINDSTDVESHKRVFFLDADCEVTGDPVRYSVSGPLDTEDLALSPDGKTLWVADTGDNVTSSTRRERVAVWSMPVSGDERLTLHRLAYPDNEPRDAEALVIDDDGVPMIITKVASGKAEIFTVDGELPSGDTAPGKMKKLGEVELPTTETENAFGALGRAAITGAARSPDGTRVALRTYADAFEYDVTDGDLVTALTSTEPRVTPLADPFGEAITYTPDGKTFLTVSDGGQLDDGEPIDVLSYSPTAKPESGPEANADGAEESTASWFDSFSLQGKVYLAVAAVGLIGVGLVAAGLTGVVRARRRPAETTGAGGPADDSGSRDATDRPRGAVYGGAPPAAGHGVRPEPGRAAAPADKREHGGGRPAEGGRPAAGVYGRRPAGGAGGAGGPRPAAGGGQGADGGRSAGGGRGGGVYGGGAGGGVNGGGAGGRVHGGGGRAQPPRRDGGGHGRY
ncbi:hypothetical protein [Salinispora sp. H7-4]|uniref:hypothetical protein n=1 Tax=Salinispora sp. H7-4 TaxID=2748321 RepID=UPI0015D42EC6|nr:hypothetical protein [Salinispora sp. H7-4]NYT96547.1 hypothetical protein [Salinispora sp. H7-4]